MNAQTTYFSELENEKVDYLNDDFEAVEAELEEFDRGLDKEQILRIQIDEGLENALSELQELQSQLPKEQTKSLLQLCGDNVIETIEAQFVFLTDNKDKSLEQLKQNREKRGYLLPHEEKHLEKLIKQNDIGNDELVKRYKQEQKKEKKIAKIYKDTKSKSTKDILTDGAKDSANQIYTAVGVVLRDFSIALIKELQIALDSLREESFKVVFTRFKDRLMQITKEIKAKWKDIFSGSLESMLTPFLHNLAVVVARIFSTTIKRAVRIIRAGFASLCKAFKTLVNPPKDMPKEDVAYEALKVLVAGLIGAVSLSLVEVIAEMLEKIPALTAIFNLPIPVLGGTIGDAVSITLSAIVGGVLTTIALYYMDKSRSQSKENRLQIQIMTKSGEIVQYKIAQTWFMLKDAWVYTAQLAQQTAETIKKADNEIKESGKKVDSAIDDTGNLIKQAQNLN